MNKLSSETQNQILRNLSDLFPGVPSQKLVEKWMLSQSLGNQSTTWNSDSQADQDEIQRQQSQESSQRQNEDEAQEGQQEERGQSEQIASEKPHYKSTANKVVNTSKKSQIRSSEPMNTLKYPRFVSQDSYNYQKQRDSTKHISQILSEQRQRFHLEMLQKQHQEEARYIKDLCISKAPYDKSIISQWLKYRNVNSHTQEQMQEWLNYSKKDYQNWMNANGSLDQCFGTDRDKEITYEQLLQYKRQFRQKLGSQAYKGTFADSDFNSKHKAQRLKIRLPTIDTKDLSTLPMQLSKVKGIFSIYADRNNLYYSPTLKLEASMYVLKCRYRNFQTPPQQFVMAQYKQFLKIDVSNLAHIKACTRLYLMKGFDLNAACNYCEIKGIKKWRMKRIIKNNMRIVFRLIERILIDQYGKPIIVRTHTQVQCIYNYLGQIQKHFPPQIRDIFFKLIRILLQMYQPGQLPVICANEVGKLYNACIDKINEGEIRRISQQQEINNMNNKKMSSTLIKYCRYQPYDIKMIGCDDGLYGIKDPFDQNTQGKFGKHWCEPFQIQVLKVFLEIKDIKRLAKHLGERFQGYSEYKGCYTTYTVRWQMDRIWRKAINFIQLQLHTYFRVCQVKVITFAHKKFLNMNKDQKKHLVSRDHGVECLLMIADYYLNNIKEKEKKRPQDWGYEVTYLDYLTEAFVEYLQTKKYILGILPQPEQQRMKVYDISILYPKKKYSVAYTRLLRKKTKADILSSKQVIQQEDNAKSQDTTFYINKFNRSLSRFRDKEPYGYLNGMRKRRSNAHFHQRQKSARPSLSRNLKKHSQKNPQQSDESLSLEDVLFSSNKQNLIPTENQESSKKNDVQNIPGEGESGDLDLNMFQNIIQRNNQFQGEQSQGQMNDIGQFPPTPINHKQRGDHYRQRQYMSSQKAQNSIFINKNNKQRDMVLQHQDRMEKLPQASQDQVIALKGQEDRILEQQDQFQEKFKYGQQEDECEGVQNFRSIQEDQQELGMRGIGRFYKRGMEREGSSYAHDSKSQNQQLQRYQRQQVPDRKNHSKADINSHVSNFFEDSQSQSQQRQERFTSNYLE